MTRSPIEDFFNLREVSILKIKEMKDKGIKVVGSYCTYCPTELILAAGAIPVSLCGTKEEPISAAERTLPRNLCPLIKSSYGFAVTDTCPFFYFSDLIVGETTCDGKKKMFEQMQQLKPVHVMELPTIKKSEASFQLWVEEIRRLRVWLEENLSVKITDEAIWQAIEIVNQERSLIKAISDLNQIDPPPLSGLSLLTVSWSRSFNSDKAETIRMLRDLKERLAVHQPDQVSVKQRILLTGCPVGLGTEKVIRLTEELGGAVVALENCSGYKTLELQTNTEYSDPIVALADKYLQIPCSCMSPNPYRLELLERMIHDFRIDAVIDLTWQACHTYNIEAYQVEQLVQQKGLPYLHLESDYSSTDLESLKVRIEALLEMAGNS